MENTQGCKSEVMFVESLYVKTGRLEIKGRADNERTAEILVKGITRFKACGEGRVV